MNLYEKLKSVDLVDDYKEYLDLISIRSIRVNDLSISNPIYEIREKDRIKVGIKVI